MSHDYKVGYGRPPKDKQWKKGQSPNPKGRPRKMVSAKPTLPHGAALLAPVFNRTVLAEAQRPIKVNGEDKTAREVVAQALTVAAARGGILAMRTWLEQVEREEAKLREARLPVYTSWATFKSEARGLIYAAIEAGETEPLILPYPDDIILDSDNLLVKLVGPTTEADLCFYEGLRETRDLFFELMMFTNTPLINFGDAADHRVGLLGLYWIQYHLKLPNRLRSADLCIQRLKVNRERGHSYWESDLRRRCELRSWDFDMLGDSHLMRTFPIEKLGMRFEGGVPVPANSKTRRELKKLIDQQCK